MKLILLLFTLGLSVQAEVCPQFLEGRYKCQMVMSDGQPVYDGAGKSVEIRHQTHRDSQGVEVETLSWSQAVPYVAGQHHDHPMAPSSQTRVNFALGASKAQAKDLSQSLAVAIEAASCREGVLESHQTETLLLGYRRAHTVLTASHDSKSFTESFELDAKIQLPNGGEYSHLGGELYQCDWIEEL